MLEAHLVYLNKLWGRNRDNSLNQHLEKIKKLKTDIDLKYYTKLCTLNPHVIKYMPGELVTKDFMKEFILFSKSALGECSII